MIRPIRVELLSCCDVGTFLSDIIIQIMSYIDRIDAQMHNPIGPDHDADAKARRVAPLHPHFPSPSRRLGITREGMDAGHHYSTIKFANSLHRARGHVV